MLHTLESSVLVFADLQARLMPAIEDGLRQRRLFESRLLELTCPAATKQSHDNEQDDGPNKGSYQRVIGEEPIASAVPGEQHPCWPMHHCSTRAGVIARNLRLAILANSSTTVAC